MSAGEEGGRQRSANHTLRKRLNWISLTSCRRLRGDVIAITRYEKVYYIGDGTGSCSPDPDSRSQMSVFKEERRVQLNFRNNGLVVNPA